MRWVRLILLIFIYCEGKTQPVSLFSDEIFIYSVKQIDEFIDRFDKRKKTFLLQYLKQKYPDAGAESLSRNVFVRQLFNYETSSWDSLLINRFTQKVTDTVLPYYLSFYDNDWYAYVKCRVWYKKLPKNLELILKVERAQNGGSKWVIVSAKADFLNYMPKYDSSRLRLPVYIANTPDSITESEFFLDPMAHSTQFMSLDEPFKNSEQFKNYLYRGALSPQVNLLTQELKRKNLVFRNVSKVSYHFLQIPGWLFIVEYFNRASKNSGWLISNLYELTLAEKEIYKKYYLNIPAHEQ